MFQQPVTQAYDLTDATWEIIIMLLVAFILGWLFHYFWSKLAVSAAAPVVSQRPEKFAKYTEDDLKIVEGIGPKIEELLKDNGVKTWKDLAASTPDQLKKILAKGGDRFQMHDPSSWADQVALAVEGKWKELDEYQDLLIGGRAS